MINALDRRGSTEEMTMHKANKARWVDRRQWQPGARIDERGGAAFFQHRQAGTYKPAAELAHVAETDAALRRMMGTN